MPADPRTHDIQSPDGRTIRAAEVGDPDGAPVVFHHGWPGSRLTPPSFDEVARERGVRIISYDRAGYGGSSPKPGRAIADAAWDTATVADALGIERFAVWGVSGGGPHSLACGALLRDRVTGVVSVSGFAPFDTPGLDFIEGMGEPSRAEFPLAAQGREAYEPFVRDAVAQAQATPPDQPPSSLDGLIAGPDPAYCEEPAIREHLRRSGRESLRPGIDGWLGDGLASVAPWGFDPGAITAPVLLLQGVYDLMVPPAHARVLAGVIPHATLVIEPDEGHLTICFDPVRPLEWLASVGALGTAG
jgi:pimeloyl-ACP methyl ester carboxylesterase